MLTNIKRCTNFVNFMESYLTFCEYLPQLKIISMKTSVKKNSLGGINILVLDLGAPFEFK